MTHEETMKVWTDLSARVMYHPKVRVTNTYLNEVYDEVLTMANFTQYADVKYEVRPYLRHISSMRVSEILDLYEFFSGKTCCLPEFTEEWGDFITAIQNNKLYIPTTCDGNKVKDGFDWLDSKHIDYRGLIPMGLAIELKEEI